MASDLNPFKAYFIMRVVFRGDVLAIRFSRAEWRSFSELSDDLGFSPKKTAGLVFDEGLRLKCKGA